ncbi:MAG: DUF5060 domain-containing protein [Planctomycetota bacterium]|nr:DUF5060 domain-containing protein [Planctomycetota bacterium]
MRYCFFPLLFLATVCKADIAELNTPEEGLSPTNGQLVLVKQDADWHDMEEVFFQVRRTSASMTNIWIYGTIENDRGWRYQSTTIKLPKDGSWLPVRWRFGKGSPNWYPSGHNRDLDDFAMRRILSMGIRASVAHDARDKIQIKDMALNRQLPQTPRVYDLILPGKPEALQTAEIRFRLSAPLRNPFDAEEADVRVRVTRPDESKQNVLAFYYQGITTEEGSEYPFRPFGAGEWRARFRPEKEGIYKFRIVVGGRYTHETKDLLLMVSPSSIVSGFIPSALEEDALKASVLKQIDRYSIASFELTPQGWNASADYKGQFPYWHAPLEWSPPRRGFYGLGQFHFSNALQLDLALAAAEKRGEQLPLRLYGNEEFHDVSEHVDYPLRWKDSPFSVVSGGPLERATEFFTSPEALKHVKNQLRYIHARFGHSPALKAVVLSTDFSLAEGPAKWHEMLGEYWNTLSARSGSDLPLVSLHPQVLQDQAPADNGPAFVPHKKFGDESLRLMGPAEVDWSAYQEIILDFELPRDAPTGMRCALLARDGDNWWYQAMAGGFLRPGDVTRLRVNLGRDGQFKPAGHGRPFTAFSLVKLIQPEIRIYSEKPFEGAVKLKQILLTKVAGGSPQLKSPGIFNLRAAEIDLPAGRLNHISFELSKVYAEPFDPEKVAVEAVIKDPLGNNTKLPAFLFQNYGKREFEGKHIETPEGPIEWQVRYRPPVAGKYSFELTVTEQNGQPMRIGNGSFTASATETVANEEGELSKESAKLVVYQVDRSYRTESIWKEGRWVSQTPLTAAIETVETAAAQKQWLANLEWHQRWGEGYKGLGNFNLRFAFHLDQAIAEAERKGIQHPLRLNGNEELHEISTNVDFTYRWKDNPLNKANGGPLALASEYFKHPATLKSVRSLLRYTLARWGQSPSVTGVVFANDMYATGAEVWHTEIAKSFAAYPPSLLGSATSYHPMAAPHQFKIHQPALSVKSKPYYKTPPPPEAPGKEVQAFVDGPGNDWSKFHLAVVRFKVPAEAPGDMRVLLSVKDEDNWWYQALHPAFLRSGDITTLIFDIAQGGDLKPVSHERPWTDFSRFSVHDVSLRLFSTNNYSGQVQLESFEFWEAPAPVQPLSIVELANASQQVPLGGTYDIEFQLNRAFRNPFDTNEVSISAQVLAPSGTVKEVNAFFSQKYKQADVSRIAVGAPHWGLRYRTAEMGRHSVQFKAELGGRGVFFNHRAEFTVIDPKPQPPSNYDSPFLLRVHDLSYKTKSEFKGGAWKTLPEPASTEDPLWHAVIEWTSRWGKYKDLGRYNLEVAWEFEKALDAAAQAGKQFPLRLNGNMELFNRRNHRWPDNPINAKNGGPVPHPSLYFSTPAALESQTRIWRYLVARYGDHPAVSDLVLAADFASKGAEDWHLKAGGFLSQHLPSNARILSYHPQVLPHQQTSVFADFEGSTTPFEPETSIEGGKETNLASSKTWASHGLSSLEIRRNFTGDGEAPLVANIEQDWFDYDTLVIDVQIPPDAPHDMRLMVFLKDMDLWYYQNLLEPFLIPGDVTRLIVDISGKNTAWNPPARAAGSKDPWAHTKPWTDGARAGIRQVGVRIFGHEKYEGPIYVDNMQLWKTGRYQPEGPIQVTRATVASDKIGLHDRFEVDFSLDRYFRNPFDLKEIEIVAVVVAPDKQVFEVPAFYYQDFDRHEIVQKSNVSEKDEPFEILTPKGVPHWKFRYSPKQEGKYEYALKVNGRVAWPQEGVASFQGIPSKFKGFIRVADDKRHFEHSTGEFYYPIGHNLRSPSDNRNNENYGAFFQQFNHRGTFQFDEFFAAMEKQGLNWARVWQCSWWMGLEWTKKWPGYQGLGRYNMENAWRLDYLLEKARQHNIYLQIDTTNHGQFSIDIDTEWKNNPWNRANEVDKGPLKRPREFFNEDMPRKTYADRIRYTMGRWGYSRNLFGWIIITESEFVDDYWAINIHNVDEGVHPPLVDWHEYAAGIFRKWDKNHIVATHFSMPFRGRDVFMSDKLDFVESNTYWQDWYYNKLKSGPAGDTIHTNYWSYHNLLNTYNKPILIGEFGGHVLKNAAARLDIELHIGSWSMAMIPYAGSTGYWWWPWLHYMDRYNHLGAVASFMKDEDRRGKELRQISSNDAKSLTITTGIEAIGLANATMADLWVFNSDVRNVVPIRLRLKDPITGATLVINSISDGNYTLEFWDTFTGKVTGKAKAAAANGSLTILLPPVHPDYAMKVRKVE